MIVLWSSERAYPHHHRRNLQDLFRRLAKRLERRYFCRSCHASLFDRAAFNTCSNDSLQDIGSLRLISEIASLDREKSSSANALESKITGYWGFLRLSLLRASKAAEKLPARSKSATSIARPDFMNTRSRTAARKEGKKPCEVHSHREAARPFHAAHPRQNSLRDV